MWGTLSISRADFPLMCSAFFLFVICVNYNFVMFLLTFVEFMFLPFICIADCYADDLSVIIVCELYLATKAVLDLESEGLITDGK